MGSLDQLGKHLATALKPLSHAASSPENFKRLLYRLGWDTENIPAEYTTLASKVDQLQIFLQTLGDSPDMGKILELFGKIKEVFEGIKSLTQSPPGVDAAIFLNEIRERLFEILIVDYIITTQSWLFNLFMMLGVIEPIHIPSHDGRPSFIRYKLKWSEIPKIITELDQVPEKIYGWGTTDFNFDLFARHVLEFFLATGVHVSFLKIERKLGYKYLGLLKYNPQVELVESEIMLPLYKIIINEKKRELGIALLHLPEYNEKLPGIIIQPNIPSQIGTSLRLREDIDLRLKAGSNIDALFGILIRPGEISVRYPFEDGTLPDFGFSAGVDYKPNTASLLLGSKNKTRLEFQGLSFDFEFNFTENQPELILGFLFNGLAIVIDTSESDSFISSILGGGSARIEIPLGFEWSSVLGIRFKGGAGFEVSLYPHLSLGPISIPELQLALKMEIDDPPNIELNTGVGIAGDLGPVQFVVQGIGMSLDMVFHDTGNIGPFDIELGFNPPKGIGLSINTTVVKGGGYLYFDIDKGEYAGALELTIQETISLKAIGILNTVMPDGTKGFSLFILVTADFPAIQLGFGFTLNAVGGMLGLNRTVYIERLRAGVKDNSLSSIMFPQDIISNIIRIISDIKQVFPPYEGHFIIGPMGKLGWGTPTIITLELGIVVEVPDPLIAILGILRTILPEEKAPILKMQVNFLGVIDFEQKEISFDASLFDSRLLLYTLSGDMALRINWGSRSLFILTVGGFHPDFREIPAGLTRLKRLSLSLLSGSNPRIIIETYFAVTSNTVQFGAKVELYAAACGFNVYGYLGFDVLFQFKPFFFVAAVCAELALREGKNVLFGVSLRGKLSGPERWKAKGKCSFTIIFTFEISFNETWGDRSNESGRELTDILEKLIEAIEDNRNWLAEIPENNSLNVSMKEIEQEPGKIIIHPFGIPSVCQKIVPLNQRIQKYGETLPKDLDYFSIEGIFCGPNELLTEDVLGQFAPGNFFNLNDAEKISRKSFEDLKGGKKLIASSVMSSGTAVPKSVDYELSYLRKRKYRRIYAGIYRLQQSVFRVCTKSTFAAKSSLSFRNRKLSINKPIDFIIQEEQYALASNEDMTLFTDGELLRDGFIASSQTEAVEMMKEIINANPSYKNALQVVPEYELNV